MKVYFSPEITILLSYQQNRNNLIRLIYLPRILLVNQIKVSSYPKANNCLEETLNCDVAAKTLSPTTAATAEDLVHTSKISTYDETAIVIPHKRLSSKDVVSTPVAADLDGPVDTSTTY